VRGEGMKTAEEVAREIAEWYDVSDGMREGVVEEARRG
jgi:hypothetical protein